MYRHELVRFDSWDLPIGYLSIAKPRKLVVFVHGFGGHAVTTWGDFIHFIRNMDIFEHCDIVFYGYESKMVQATTNGSLLKQFLDQIYFPSPHINGVERKVPKEYEKIVLVAHSLGAFVVRKALVHAYKSHASPWYRSCRMILLAPAHNGSEIPERVMDALPGLLKITATIAKFFMPVIEDLQKDSVTIKNLKSDTLEMQKNGHSSCTIADYVGWAEYERVVINDDFCSDPAPETIRGRDHINVCKPTFIEYELPFNKLSEKL